MQVQGRRPRKQIVANGQGFFAESTAPPSGARRMSLGRGLPSVPRVSIAPDGSDRVTLKTSSGRVVTIDPPERDEDPAELVYWRQLF